MPGPIGRRPVVLVSRDEAYRGRNSVTVAEVTTKVRGLSIEVALGKEEGLPKGCVVNLNALYTIEKALLTDYAGILSSDKIEQMNAALRIALDL